MSADNASSLPSAILDHVYGEALEEWYNRLVQTKRLLDIDREALDAAVWKVYARESTIDEFIRTLEEHFGTSERAAEIAIEILGHDFLFIENHLGVNIVEYIRMLGGDPALYVHAADPEEVAEEIIQTDGVVLSMDSAVQHRLKLVMASFLTDARTRQQALDSMARGIKIGGAGIGLDEAERLCTAVEAKRSALRTAGVVFRKEVAPLVAESSFHLVKPVRSGLIQPEDEEGLRRAGTSVAVSLTEMGPAIDRLVARTGAKFGHPDVERRFRTAIESYFRDVRDRLETLDLLTRPKDRGGFAIPPERAERVLTAAAEERRAFFPDPVTRQRYRVGKVAAPHAEEPPLPALAPPVAVTPQLVHPAPLRPTSSFTKPKTLSRVLGSSVSNNRPEWCGIHPVPLKGPIACPDLPSVGADSRQ
ncbi:MAG: hypothetical protein V1723_01785 [Candidatus Uhrbacteria bacterium]